MGIQCGIVGLPNVGKSTLFNALTQASIAAENFPFCTIDPNTGIVPIADPRLDAIAAITKPQKTIPTSMTFVDIAGLVAGASQGEGLGNQFLNHIRTTDAIAHMVRCFENNEVIHVANEVNPINDVAVIETELMLADLETLEKALTKVNRAAKSGDKVALATKQLYEKLIAALDEDNPIRALTLNEQEHATIKSLGLLTAKPMIYIANISDNNQHEAHLQALQNHAQNAGCPLVTICAQLEAETMDLSAEDKSLFLQDIGIKMPGLDQMIHACYDLLGLHTFFTAGPKEVRAWTIPKETNATDAAAVIHTDFKRGFIRAETISYSDYIKYKGSQGAKEAGKLRLEGKDYIVQDGDVLLFRFNV